MSTSLGERISDLGAASTVHTDDLLLVVDTHDQSMAGSGTDKRLPVSVLLAGIVSNLTSTSIPWMDGTGYAGSLSAFARADHVHPTDGSRVAAALLGAANGVATLDSSGHLPASQLTQAVVGAMVYQGVWNASTNSPTLASGVGTKGFYRKVSVAGTTAIDGLSQWNVGDIIVFNGTTWDKIDAIPSEVTSVAGRVGAVVLTLADVVRALQLSFSAGGTRYHVTLLGAAENSYTGGGELEPILIPISDDGTPAWQLNGSDGTIAILEGTNPCGTYNITQAGTISGPLVVTNLSVKSDGVLDTSYLPASGAAGTMLVKNSTSDYDVAWSPSYYSPLVTNYMVFVSGITYAVSVSFEAGNVHAVTIQGGSVNNITLGGGKAGARYLLVITSANTSTIALAASDGTIKWQGGSAPIWSDAAGKTDLVAVVFDGTNYYCAASIGY